jgi:hypothetical protein
MARRVRASYRGTCWNRWPGNVKPRRMRRVAAIGRWYKWFARQEGERKSRGGLLRPQILSRRSKRTTERHGESPRQRHRGPPIIRQASSVDIEAFLRGASWFSSVLCVKNPRPDNRSVVEWQDSDNDTTTMSNVPNRSHRPGIAGPISTGLGVHHGRPTRRYDRVSTLARRHRRIRLLPFVQVNEVRQLAAPHRSELAHRIADRQDRIGMHARRQAQCGLGLLFVQ